MKYFIVLTFFLQTVSASADNGSGLCLFVDKRLANHYEAPQEASAIYPCSSEGSADAYDYYIYNLKKISSELSTGSTNHCVFIYDREPGKISFIKRCLNYVPALDYDYTVFEFTL